MRTINTFKFFDFIKCDLVFYGLGVLYSKRGLYWDFIKIRIIII